MDTNNSQYFLQLCDWLLCMLIRANTKFVDNSCYYYLIINHQSEMQMVDDILRNVKEEEVYFVFLAQELDGEIKCIW